MKLSESQIRFFQTFGYVGIPKVFSPPEMAWISEEFEKVIDEHGGAHDGSRRTMVLAPIEYSTKLCTLLDDQRVEGILASVLGDDFNYCAGDGNYYSGDTAWHPDGTWGRLFAAKLAFYLDPVRRDTGCLRVVPGSQDPGHFIRRQARAGAEDADINRSEEWYGVLPREYPGNVALETNPGDLVMFNHDTYHAAFGGGSRRRMFTMNCTRHAHNAADIKDLRNYLSVHTVSGYKQNTGSGMFRPLMWNTASNRRMIHLRQPDEIHDEVFPELARRKVTATVA